MKKFIMSNRVSAVIVMALFLLGAASGSSFDWVRIRPGTLPASGTNGEIRVDSADGYLKKYSTGSSSWVRVSSEGGSSGNPSGTVISFAGTACPTGYLLADGSAVSRTTYADLFTAISESWGQGDNSTTFNLPDLRGLFLRGRVGISNVTGSGTASSSNATFTAHGYVRTGLKVRLSSGTLSGLSASTDYWVIVVDTNTLAFATTRANALAGTKIAISGANSAVIAQAMDPGASSRVTQGTGANSADNVGSYEEDALQGHYHGLPIRSDAAGVGAQQIPPGNNAGAYNNTYSSFTASSETAMGTVRIDAETRPLNAYVLYCIKE